MTDAIPSQIDELLERRATYAEWLDRLDEVIEEARPEVVRRIRADYRERLDAVRSELQEHREDLAGDLEERSRRVERLESEREEHLARREEAEIRHRVGEYGEDEWDSRRRELDGTIRELDEGLEEERNAISQLRSALEIMDESSGFGEGPAAAAVDEADDEAVQETIEEEAEEDRPPLRLVEEDETRGEALEETASEKAGETAPSREGGESELNVREDPTGRQEEETRAEPGRPEPEERGVADEKPADGPVETPAGTSSEGEEEPSRGRGDDEAYDELEFLESLSLDDTDQFDAVSAMLDAEEEDDEDEGPSNGSGARRPGSSGGEEG